MVNENTSTENKAVGWIGGHSKYTTDRYQNGSLKSNSASTKDKDVKTDSSLLDGETERERKKRLALGLDPDTGMVKGEGGALGGDGKKKKITNIFDLHYDPVYVDDKTAVKKKEGAVDIRKMVDSKTKYAGMSMAEKRAAKMEEDGLKFEPSAVGVNSAAAAGS